MVKNVKSTNSFKAESATVFSKLHLLGKLFIQSVIGNFNLNKIWLSVNYNQVYVPCLPAGLFYKRSGLGSL